MKLRLITEAAVALPGVPADIDRANGIPAGHDRANLIRAAIVAGIPGGIICKKFGISRARLSHIKSKLQLMGWVPGTPISPEMMSKAYGKI